MSLICEECGREANVRAVAEAIEEGIDKLSLTPKPGAFFSAKTAGMTLATFAAALIEQAGLHGKKVDVLLKNVSMDGGAIEFGLLTCNIKNRTEK